VFVCQFTGEIISERYWKFFVSVLKKLFRRGIGKEYPVRIVKWVVRFGTEKIIGFPRLSAIFAGALIGDSSTGGAEDWVMPLRNFGLAKC
jgi:hypothetical protein